MFYVPTEDAWYCLLLTVVDSLTVESEIYFACTICPHLWEGNQILSGKAFSFNISILRHFFLEQFAKNRSSALVLANCPFILGNRKKLVENVLFWFRYCKMRYWVTVINGNPNQNVWITVNYCNPNITVSDSNWIKLIWVTVINGNPNINVWITVNYCNPNIKVWITISYSNPNK